jgi:plastocyanin
MRLWLKASHLLPAAPLVAALVLAACGAGEAKNNTNVSNSGPGVVATAPSFGSISSATPAGTGTASAGGTGGAAVASAAQTFTVVAKDNVYDKKELTIQANQSAALTLKNEGSAIHNIEVKDAKDKDGKDIKGKLIPGGQSDTIVFTIEKTGTYDYFCEVHPTEMRGKLTVK